MFGICNDAGEIISEFVTPLAMTSNVPIFASDTLSLRHRVYARAAQRWELETKLVPLSTDANELFVLITTKGHSGEIKIRVPQNWGALQKTTANSPCLVTGSADSNLISIRRNAGIIAKGTFIKFHNHEKIYMLVDDVVDIADDIKIFPKLHSNVNGQMFHQDVIMPVFLDTSSVVGMSYIDGVLMDNGVMKFLENLI